MESLRHSAHHFSSSLPEQSNFFITQSAIEHFPKDLRFFSQIGQWVSRRGKKAVQVHLFPSPACLKLYGLHGYRQYTIRSVQKILRCLDGSYSNASLGGTNCNDVHLRYITEPLQPSRTDLRKTKTKEYFDSALSALNLDFDSRDISNPIFCALWIQSGIDSDLKLP